MIKFFAYFAIIWSASVALESDREFGHPLFRTFTAHDYGEVGQIFTVTEIFRVGCSLALPMLSWHLTIPLAKDSGARNRIYQILTVDSRGVVWFSSRTRIGYLSRVDGAYQVVKVFEGWFGENCRMLVNGGQI